MELHSRIPSGPIEKLWDQARSLEPNHCLSHWERGNVRAQLAHWEEAAADLRRTWADFLHAGDAARLGFETKGSEQWRP